MLKRTLSSRRFFLTQWHIAGGPLMARRRVQVGGDSYNLSEDETSYNKNNNFDNRRISRTPVLGAQKNCLIETLLLSA